MIKQDALGSFELLTLAAVDILEGNAYGRTVHEKVEELGGRNVLLGPIYVTLERLETKGHLYSWETAPIPERGGRRRRCYRLELSGRRALNDALDSVERILLQTRGKGLVYETKYPEQSAGKAGGAADTPASS